jgi:hypothetical protein
LHDKILENLEKTLQKLFQVKKQRDELLQQNQELQERVKSQVEVSFFLFILKKGENQRKRKEMSDSQQQENSEYLDSTWPRR